MEQKEVRNMNYIIINGLHNQLSGIHWPTLRLPLMSPVQYFHFPKTNIEYQYRLLLVVSHDIALGG